MKSKIPVKTQNKRRSGFFASKLIVSSLIITLSATSGFAIVMPVYDFVNHEAQFQVAAMQEQNRYAQFSIQENNRYEEFFSTMNQWAQQFRNYREQFDHARQVWNEVDQMRGNWRGAVQRLTDQEFVRAVVGEDGRDLVRLGWEIRNNPTNPEVLPDQALEALDRIEKVMNNRQGNQFPNGSDPTMRDDLAEIYGQVPATRPDIEYAHRNLARATATIAGINKAIDERRLNIQQWKQKISTGGLVPGDLERLQLQINAEQQDIQLLTARIGTLNIEMQMANTGLLAAEESDREISRARAESVAASFMNGAGLMSPQQEQR